MNMSCYFKFVCEWEELVFDAFIKTYKSYMVLYKL